jgi:SNF2 family DNA or RNA helicase
VDVPTFESNQKTFAELDALLTQTLAFILDPWWNPAVETQAIDRAHRVGQTRQVFAYRLICKNTVEEKITELQQAKRELADAILEQNNSIMQGLTTDDLRLLLS